MLLAFLCEVYIFVRGCFEKRFGRLMLIPLGFVLKIGDASVGAEADTLRFIREYTSIPVPRVYAADRAFGRTYCLMEEVKGAEELHFVWRELSAKHRGLVLDQLRDVIRQLRSLRPPPCVLSGAICSLYNEATRDSRIASAPPLGPFPNEAAFNDRLIKASELFLGDDILSDIRPRMREDHRIVFTHGDLAPRNIMVRGHRIVAILDWEESGWYPEHWELVKALWYPGLPDGKDPEWNEGMKDIVGREYEKDYDTDHELSGRMVGAF